MKAKFGIIWNYKWPILLYLSALIVVQIGPYYYKSDTYRAFLYVQLPILYDLLRDYEFVVTCTLFGLGAAIPLFGMPSIKSAFGRNLPLNEKGLLTFLKLLDVPVEFKLDRFCQKICHTTPEDAKKKSVASFASSIFLEITQPEKQFKTIIESIFGYYSAIDTTNAKFKVVLFFIDNDTISGMPFYYPRDCSPSTPVDVLRNPKSAVMVAVKSGRPVIIENIKKPPKGIEFARAEGDDRPGSIMCFPIRINHVNKSRMVLSVFTETPGYFKKSNLEIYEFVIKPFQKRLVIEYCLLALKKMVQAQKGEV